MASQSTTFFGISTGQEADSLPIELDESLIFGIGVSSDEIDALPQELDKTSMFSLSFASTPDEFAIEQDKSFMFSFSVSGFETDEPSGKAIIMRRRYVI